MLSQTVDRLSLRLLGLLVRWTSRRYPDANARRWSNRQLRRFGSLFNGDVINVSAGADRDKEGGRYRDYFSAARSYRTSNFNHDPEGDANQLLLDLSVGRGGCGERTGQFDVVFSHTVLEHIYNIDQAVQNLCAMTRDCVITIVPALQSYHHNEPIFKDFWRFSPFTLIELFKAEGLSTIYLDWNSAPVGNVYLFHIATRSPDRWQDVIRMPSRHCQETEGPGYWHQYLQSGCSLSNGKLRTLEDAAIRSTE